jgi:hypothetical protein
MDNKELLVSFFFPAGVAFGVALILGSLACIFVPSYTTEWVWGVAILDGLFMGVLGLLTEILS